MNLVICGQQTPVIIDELYSVSVVTQTMLRKVVSVPTLNFKVQYLDVHLSSTKQRYMFYSALISCKQPETFKRGFLSERRKCLKSRDFKWH